MRAKDADPAFRPTCDSKTDLLPVTVYWPAMVNVGLRSVTQAKLEKAFISSACGKATKAPTAMAVP